MGRQFLQTKKAKYQREWRAQKKREAKLGGAKTTVRERSNKLRSKAAKKGWARRRANGTDTRRLSTKHKLSADPSAVASRLRRRRKKSGKVKRTSSLNTAVGLARCNYCPNCGTMLAVVNNALDLTAAAAIGGGE